MYELNDLKKFMETCRRVDIGHAAITVPGWEAYKLHVYSSKNEANIEYNDLPVAKIRFVDENMVKLYRVTCGVCDFDAYEYVGAFTAIDSKDVKRGIGTLPQNFIMNLLGEGGEE